jgi:hypothetical protein
MEPPEFVLFMTPSCKFCNNLIAKLQTKDKLVKKFNFVNIDQLPAIPDEVDEVPCIYDGKGLFKGANAFKWLTDRSADFLDPANDGLQYSFIGGNEERVFNNYSLLEQKNGTYGMGDPSTQKMPQEQVPIQNIGNQMVEPMRPTAPANDKANLNQTLESLMAARSAMMQQ